MRRDVVRSAKCPANCAMCSNNGYCFACVNGYNLHNGQCLLRATVCAEGCESCGSNGTCTSCGSGYDLIDGACVTKSTPCPENCQSCDNLGKCLACSPAYDLINGACQAKKCPECCPDCIFNAEGKVECHTCNPFISFKDGQCLPCGAGIHGCASCRDCGCIQCVTGFYLSAAGTCTECAEGIPNCATCSGADSCTSCVRPYVLEPSTGQCVMNSPLPYNERTPKKCEDGKYLTEDGRCVDCYYTCSKCRGPGAMQCTGCKENATLYGGTGNTAGTCKCNEGFTPNRLTKRCESVNNS
eukprot:TRINITY_DN1502_c0_g1_i8.p1 TRINITY_DN1502_c0_g1~~TRINITY_DN1502_c0_g1_i8.p1  ORF type:complete len:298 (-),score=13.76 TRINITY_DN1502_c0_g1_i8:106-999(-)